MGCFTACPVFTTLVFVLGEFMTTDPRDADLAPLPPRWRVFRGQQHQEDTANEQGDSAAPNVSVPSYALSAPFILSPDFAYDVQLNAFFYSTEMLSSRMATRVGYAHDLARFLTFLENNRGGKNWRDCQEADHLAFHRWRREDKLGLRVSEQTWNREVSAANRFYVWQLKQHAISELPIPQRDRRHVPGRRAGNRSQGTTPATLTHAGSEARVSWLPSKSYRRWRDIGVRGYLPNGLPDPKFRGRWASRNAVFMDLMVRTGMRLSEQSALLVAELPAVKRLDGFHQFTLPAASSKSNRPRTVYIPSGVLRDIHDYIEFDRPLLVERGRRRGIYRWNRDALLLDPDSGRVRQHGATRSFRSALLTYEERQSLLVEGPDGIEPASLWLAESGLPMSTSTWQDVFAISNHRCTRSGAHLSAHAHLLRHTYAVLTLEQLQRGHIASLRDLLPTQRSEYVRVFGDPLDWIRRRLGHKSIETTHIYMHTLADLEMETRMALIPDEWDDARNPALWAEVSSEPTS
jgi:site-specific recombinase XerD